ncbi:Toxin HigB / Protein kinase domain of HipA [hydrothermal vent metagenome]|uniref:Toxin HigB / Protein kinase domain of HipA n=1 Tax=hydrothermal vent metagenome TaxID=652676 RepID=A0A3B1AFF6_9ZZZZ
MTPLYDIMSAYPLLANKQLQAKKIKMAMAISGKNRHYLWHTIQPRHFLSTAKQAGFNEKTARTLVVEMMDALDEVIARIEAMIPDGFPDTIATPILTSMRKQRDRYAAGLEN